MFTVNFNKPKHLFCSTFCRLLKGIDSTSEGFPIVGKGIQWRESIQASLLCRQNKQRLPSTEIRPDRGMETHQSVASPRKEEFRIQFS